jgi:hypothetical protein
MLRDTNQFAAEIVKLATGQSVEPEPDPGAGKNAHAVALGRLGGLKGGIARKTNFQRPAVQRLPARLFRLGGRSIEKLNVNNVARRCRYVLNMKE